jgi:hypothetical protein
LFDQHTTLKTDADWLFFNIERLSDDPKLETAMSMMIGELSVSLRRHDREVKNPGAVYAEPACR